MKAKRGNCHFIKLVGCREKEALFPVSLTHSLPDLVKKSHASTLKSMAIRYATKEKPEENNSMIFFLFPHRGRYTEFPSDWNMNEHTTVHC